MKSVADLPDGATVFLDTAPLIYHLKGGPLAERFAALFERIDQGNIEVVVSAVTLAELMGGPLAAQNEVLAARYQSALQDSPGWHLRSIDAGIAVLAARLRLRYKLRLPDALQLATAVETRCLALVTHDDDFSRVKELPILRR